MVVVSRATLLWIRLRSTVDFGVGEIEWMLGGYQIKAARIRMQPLQHVSECP